MSVFCSICQLYPLKMYLIKLLLSIYPIYFCFVWTWHFRSDLWSNIWDLVYNYFIRFLVSIQCASFNGHFMIFLLIFSVCLKKNNWKIYKIYENMVSINLFWLLYVIIWRIIILGYKSQKVHFAVEYIYRLPDSDINIWNSMIHIIIYGVNCYYYLFLHTFFLAIIYCFLGIFRNFIILLDFNLRIRFAAL